MHWIILRIPEIVPSSKSGTRNGSLRRPETKRFFSGLEYVILDFISSEYSLILFGIGISIVLGIFIIRNLVDIERKIELGGDKFWPQWWYPIFLTVLMLVSLFGLMLIDISYPDWRENVELFLF